MKIQKEFRTQQGAEKAFKRLATSGQDLKDNTLNLIQSKGKFYVEDGIPFVRSFEKVIKTKTVE